LIKTLAAQIKEYKSASIMTPICMVVEVAMEMIIPLLMASLIDDGVGKGDINHIYKIGGIMLVIAAIGLFAGLLGARLASKASAGFARNLRKTMFDNIQSFSFSNIDKFSTSGLITRLTTDVATLQNAFQMILRMCVRAPITLIIAMVMAFTINARLASIYLAAVAGLSVIIAILISKAMKYFTQVFQRYDDLNATVQENVSAIRVVKAFVREKHENEKFKEASGNLYNTFVKAEKIVSWNSPIMSGTVYTCILAISWIGAQMIINSTLTTGELMSLLTYCMNILMSLIMVSVIFVMVTMSAASAKRISEVLNENTEITNPRDPQYYVSNGNVLFSHVDFAYENNKNKPVLKDISFSVRSGETVGIMGATGSSKTTLVNLISRLYDVTSGSVMVGDYDVREYDIETLRDSVSVVLQNNTLFSGTVLDNLRWGNQFASEEECVRACKLACADEFIQNMPDGYNTVIEQGGSNISGGQKQRLCIARALLKQPRVIIFDDSTSAVDTATDAKIRKALSENIPYTTKFIIAQRIASIKDADKIIVLEDGAINGIGTHEQLLETNEIYREVFESQTGGSGDFDEGGDA